MCLPLSFSPLCERKEESMWTTDVYRVWAGLVCGTICAIGFACYSDTGLTHELSASEMRATVGAVDCVDKIAQDNCTSEHSACIETAGAEGCAVLACTKCTEDKAYSDCNVSGTRYKTCEVTTTGGGCGTIRTAPCTIQDSKCKCGTYVGTTNSCAQKTVTKTTNCPE